MKLADFLNSINHSKEALLDKDEKAYKAYPAFIVNKSLSYFSDTIFYANEMNCAPWLDAKMQFDFHRIGIRKKKRYSPWVKKLTEENIEIIKAVYGYSDGKAQEVLNILSPQDLEKLKNHLQTGGTK